MIDSLAILGAGTMGTGIAIAALAAGLPVRLVDRTEAAVEGAAARIARHFDRQVEKGRLAAAEAAARQAGLSRGTDLAAVAGAVLVIEAVFEDMGVKRALLADLAPHLGAETVVATNTSALRVGDLAGAIAGPERFLGLHFFSPAEVNQLVEVVSGPATSEHAVALARGFVKRIGKIALLCRDAPGFAVNRFFCPYTNEAVRLLDEGVADAAQIDRVARESFDLAMGPFAVMNIIKPRINLNAVRHLGPLGPSYAPAAGLVATGEADRAWAIGAETPLDPAAEAEVAARLRAAVFLPVLEELAEDVARPEDIDTGARLALRFGRPPVALMREAGEARVRELVGAHAARFATPLPEAGLARLFA